MFRVEMEKFQHSQLQKKASYEPPSFWPAPKTMHMSSMRDIAPPPGLPPISPLILPPTPEINNPETEKVFRTLDVTASKDYKFEDFFLKPELLHGIQDVGYAYPSPIQRQMIPQFLQRKCMVVRAKSGTGKTGAYAIPMLQMASSLKSEVQGLILVPTRELAVQVTEVMEALSRHMDLRVCALMGGTKLSGDVETLSLAPHIVVGTPGRVADLITKGLLVLNSMDTLVLDEIDKLLAQDFKSIIESLVSHRPSGCQVALVSTTYPPESKLFVGAYLPSALTINMMPEYSLLGVSQYYIYVKEEDKILHLKYLLGKVKISQGIVFCNSNKRVEFLYSMLCKRGYNVVYIHSQMGQNERLMVINHFKELKTRLIVTSDLMTRGLDFPNVNLIINYDIPKTSEIYLHRVGRAGRFGKLALAVNFIKDTDKEQLFKFQNELKSEVKPFTTGDKGGNLF